MRRLFTGRCES